METITLHNWMIEWRIFSDSWSDIDEAAIELWDIAYAYGMSKSEIGIFDDARDSWSFKMTQAPATLVHQLDAEASILQARYDNMTIVRGQRDGDRKRPNQAGQ